MKKDNLIGNLLLNKKWLTIKEAAIALNRSPSHVQRLITQHKLTILPKTKRTEVNKIMVSSVQSYTPLKRCEPCDHADKKACLKCKQIKCLNDYYSKGSFANAKRPYCKDCDLASRQKSKKLKTVNGNL